MEKIIKTCLTMIIGVVCAAMPFTALASSQMVKPQKVNFSAIE